MRRHPASALRNAIFALGSGVLATVIAACSSMPGNDQGPAPQSFVFPDGGTAIHYVLDRGPRSSGDARRFLVAVIGGSDCRSMAGWLPAYLDGLDGKAGETRVVFLQKRFVPHAASGAGACSEAFTRHDHASRWIEDHASVIRHLREQAPGRRLVLLGISEGAEVVPLLARRLGGVAGVALLASGAMDPLEAYRLQAARFGLPTAAITDAAAGRHRPPDPDAPVESLGGRSWRYWSEIGSLAPTENLLALGVPVIAAMGTGDDQVPPESLDRLRERFARVDPGRLLTLAFPRAGHDLVDRPEGRSRLPDFWRAFDAWLARLP